MFWYVETTVHEYIFKVIDYEHVLNIKRIAAMCASLKSISVKQLMTLSYMTPELVSNEEFYQSPQGLVTFVYSLGILAYKIILGLCRSTSLSSTYYVGRYVVTTNDMEEKVHKTKVDIMTTLGE